MRGVGIGLKACAGDGQPAEEHVAHGAEVGPVVSVGEPERRLGRGVREGQLLGGEGLAEGGLRGGLSGLLVNPEGVGMVGRCGRERAEGVAVRPVEPFGALRDDVAGQREEHRVVAVLLDALGIHLLEEVGGDFLLVAVQLRVLGVGHHVPVVEGAHVVGGDRHGGSGGRHGVGAEGEAVVDGGLFGGGDFEHGHLGVNESFEVHAHGQRIVGRLGGELLALHRLLTIGARVLHGHLERPVVGHLLDVVVVDMGRQVVAHLLVARRIEHLVVVID